MSKLLKPADTESHDDDVAGLFNRLGGRDDTRAYQDFSHSQTRVSAPARPRAEVPPIPAATLTPVVSAAPVFAPVETAVVETPVVATPAQSTPLEQLFQRLAGARSASPGHSPLSRLRGA